MSDDQNSPSPSRSTISSALERNYLRQAANFQPWTAKSEEDMEEQAVFQEILVRFAGATHFGPNCFVSPEAQILTSYFSIGSNSWVAAGAIIRGHIIIGSNCSVNPYAHVAGTVRIGDGVRIAGQVSIYGFNHGYARTDVPIYQQPHTSKGIVIADDTWIGAGSVIVDGVTIREHCIIAAGAIVTKDIEAWSIAAGNPAMVIRKRNGKASEV